MPRPGVALFVMPRFDKATEYGYYYMNKAAQYASNRIFIRALGVQDATKENIDASLDSDDPLFCYWLGHGNPDTYTAQNQEVVMMTCRGNERLIDRVLLLLSCSCGANLAPDSVQKGAKAVFAYEVDFNWVAVTEPEIDRYARGFFDSVNAISNSLADGRTAEEANSISLASWDRWIDEWAGSDDPYASAVIQNMIHDRDGQKLFGDASARITAPMFPPEVPPGELPVPFPIPLITGYSLAFLFL